MKTLPLQGPTTTPRSTRDACHPPASSAASLTHTHKMISSTRRVSNLAAHLCAPSAAAAVAAAPTMYLNTGAAMPVLGLGTFQASSCCCLLAKLRAPQSAASAWQPGRRSFWTVSHGDSSPRALSGWCWCCSTLGGSPTAAGHGAGRSADSRQGCGARWLPADRLRRRVRQPGALGRYDGLPSSTSSCQLSTRASVSSALPVQPALVAPPRRVDWRAVCVRACVSNPPPDRHLGAD
eukprot:COSAG06_NODE_13864_length_1211_cov_2.067446_1_plen_236_part_00